MPERSRRVSERRSGAVSYPHLGLLISGKIIKKVFPLIAFSFTIIITVFLIHGLFNRENQNVLAALGPLKFYKEGLLYASRIGLNILNMLLAFAMFVLTTKPATLVDDLEQAGFSPRFGYMISSVFQIIPQMMGTMNTIMDAQRSRGMETEGSLFVRAKAFIPLISPVVSLSLIHIWPTVTVRKSWDWLLRGFVKRYSLPRRQRQKRRRSSGGI